jgi:hypothetical protein
VVVVSATVVVVVDPASVVLVSAGAATGEGDVSSFGKPQAPATTTRPATTSRGGRELPLTPIT